MNSKKKIIHADDVDRWRDFVKDTLCPDFDVVTVADCDGVLPRLEREEFDLAVLDLLMPGTGDVDTGYEVLQRVREKYPTLPVVMFTGAGFGANVDREEWETKWDVAVVFKHDEDAAEALKRRVTELLS